MFKKLSRSRLSRRRPTHRPRRFEALERRNLLTFVTQIGGDGNDWYRSQATDDSGNTYIAGRFTGTSDFGGTTPYTSEYTTAFVAKYDSNGAYLWAHVFDLQGGNTKRNSPFNNTQADAMDISLGDDGDVFVAGNFTDDIDLGDGTYVSSAGLGDMFIAKLDGDDGVTKWAKTIGGAGADSASAIAFSNGLLYVTGGFEETVVFDPGDETNETSRLTSPGSRDSASQFFLVLQPVIPDNPQDPEDVSFVRAWSIDGTTSQWFASELLVDGNQLFVAGRFRGTVDFNPSSDVGYPSSYYDHFVASYTTSGSFNWVQFPGEPADDHFHATIDIALDGGDGLYVANDYGVTVSNTDLTLAKYRRDNGQIDPNFTPKHFDRISSDASVMTRGLIVDSTTGELYMGVRYSGTIDLNPELDVVESPPPASFESALLRLDASGNYLKYWHSEVEHSTPTGVVDNTLYVVGAFSGTETLPGNNELTSAGGDDIYLLGLTLSDPNNDPPTAVANGPAIAVDEDVDVFFDGLGSSDPEGDSLTYAWDFGDGNTGSGESVTHAYTSGGTFYVTLTVTDTNGGQDADSIWVTITEVNDAPVAVDDAATASSDVEQVVDVLANDSDPDGDTVVIDSVETPTANGGTVVINPDNTLSYISANGFTGADSFNYTIRDGKGGMATATVTIDVTDVTETAMYVSDISFQSRKGGKEWRAIFEIRDEFGQVLPGVSVTFTFPGEPSVTRTTDANGQVQSDWVRLSSGTYEAEVTDLVLADYTWDMTQDVFNEDESDLYPDRLLTF